MEPEFATGILKELGSVAIILAVGKWYFGQLDKRLATLEARTNKAIESLAALQSVVNNGLVARVAKIEDRIWKS